MSGLDKKHYDISITSQRQSCYEAYDEECVFNT